jgi:hypothetical protein
VEVEGTPVGVEDKLPADNRAEVDSREVEADTRAEEADSPAVAVDSPVEEADSPVEEADSPVEEVDSPVEEVDSPAVADSPAAVEEDSSLPVEGLRRRLVCRTWGRRCCPGSRVCRSWGSRMQAEYRTRYRISGRGRYWRRTWGTLSIAAYYLSITYRSCLL